MLSNDMPCLAADRAPPSRRGADRLQLLWGGEWSINEAIASGCASVGALGGKLKCGTNCGSCVPELNALLAAQRTRRNGGAQRRLRLGGTLPNRFQLILELPTGLREQEKR